MKYLYKTKGTCSREIALEINEDKIIENAVFVGGCNGNAQGISRLVEGMTAAEAIKKLKGIKCGLKSTSCPDQLTLALGEAVKKLDNTESDDSNESEEDFDDTDDGEEDEEE
jgi:uncharacterized protein (TIGR03905 family)